MRDPQKQQPTVLKTELEIFAHNYIIKVILYVIMPILITLAGYFAFKKNTISLLMILWILLIDIVVIVVDRRRIAQAQKAKTIGALYQLQVISCGLLLFYGICILGRWELIPWTFAFYYLAIIVSGIKGGSMIAGTLIVSVCLAYPFSAPPASVSVYDLMIRFIPSSILCIVFMASTEHVRNTYRRRLVSTNAGLAESEEKYRSLYNQLTIEIGERKKMENRLLHTQKMESIGTLAAGIAHDFNNLLFPIVGMAELLLLELPSGSPEHQNAHEILEAGNKASDLVTQILSFARKTDRKKIPVSLPQILRQVLKFIHSLIPSYIEIDQDIQKDCGMVAGEPTKIHQVIMNLITNAFHAVESAKGKIFIQLKEVVIEDQDGFDSPLTPGPYVLLSVCDTGHGMDIATLEKIFDPYFTTKDLDKGTGLGLAVVYGIVSELEGSIEVYSEIDRGSTFDIYLPIIDHPVEKAPEKTAVIQATGDERILLVDDDTQVLTVQQRLLKKLGYQVSAESNAADALRAFKADPQAYDLVLTDMAMPGLSGDRLAKALMSIRPDIPIIICTGFSESITPEQAMAIGIRGFLMKPIQMADLAQMVRKLLDGCDGSN
ncbi:MAG: response regulator [Pseudomonadota bacterium]